MDIWEYIRAFITGGIICAIGQILIDKTKLTPARILTSYVVLGVILGAVGIFEPLKKWGGAGATVPIIGFGNLLAQGVKKAIDSTGALGIFTGAFTAAAGGICAAVFFACLVAMIFKPKHKK